MVHPPDAGRSTPSSCWSWSASVDDALNSTSLILLFTVGDTKLLFPGDAQIENWQYALKLSDRSEQIVKKLETVDVYKVGHHGSLQRDAEGAVGHVQKRKKGLER